VQNGAGESPALGFFVSGIPSTLDVRTCSAAELGANICSRIIRDATMKLDKELVREILLAVEAHDEAQGWMTLVIEGRSHKDVSYHVMLLDEAGLLSAISLGGLNHFEWQPKRLTYQGHEFLDTIRDGEVWRRTKEGAEKVGGASLGVLIELGKAYGKQIFKERLGIELP